MPIVNLTDLVIRIADADGRVYKTFEPTSHPLTIRTRGDERDVDGVTVDVTEVTGVVGLPEPRDGTFYIVPQPVFYTSNRADLVTPDTGPTATLDDEQRVYAVQRLYTVIAAGEAAGAAPSDEPTAGASTPGTSGTA